MTSTDTQPGGRLLMPGECRRVWQPLYPNVLAPWLQRQLTGDPDELQALDPACLPDEAWPDGRPLDLPRYEDRMMVVLTRQVVSYAPLGRSWHVALDPAGLIIAAGEASWVTESLPASTASPP